MSMFSSKLKARLKFSQQISPSLRQDIGWVRAALQCVEKGGGLQGSMDPSKKGLQESTLWEKDLIDRMKVINLASQENILSASNHELTSSNADLSSESSSQKFWETGSLDCKILDGFYSVTPSMMLKERFKSIPTIAQLKELALDTELDVLLVDSHKDKILAKLKDFVLALVSDSKANSVQLVKDIAEVVADFYGGPLLEAGTYTGSAGEAVKVTENDEVVQLLGEIKLGSCHPRAILFKYLGDALGLQTRIFMGLQLEEVPGTFFVCSKPNKHFSNVVDLNGVEFLVDVMGYPGHLRPLSVKSLVSYHTSAPGDSDSADNNSCDSPLEPNSPLYGNMESPSRSDPDLTGSCLQLRHKKALSADYEIPSSCPEYPIFKSRALSKLSGSKQQLGDDADENRLSSSDNSPQHQRLLGKSSTLLSRRRTTSSFKSGESGRISHSLSCDVRRVRKRSTPEISDDIVRVVRAMNQVMKHSQSETRLTDDREKNTSCEVDSQGSRYENKTLTEIMEERNISANINKDFPAIGWCPSVDDDTTISSGSWENTNFEIFSENTSQRQSQQIDFPPKAAAVSDPVNSLTWKDALSFSDGLQRHPLLPYAEWNIDFSELRIGIRVGIGSFGEVFRGIWRGTEVAIKVMLEQNLTKENTDYYCNEISLLSRLRHPNVILFLGACTKPPHLSTVTEYMHMGSLYHLIHLSGQGKKLSWRRRLKMLRDICRGMMCVQRMKIIHRDLKSANCLVDKHWSVKVCDFGLSRMTNGTPIQESTVAGTPEWMAPELLRNEPVTHKCDIFSFGVIMWELCTLRRPWEGVPPMQVVNAVARENARLEIPDGLLGSLIADCWAEAPAARPSYEEILTRLHECEFLQS